MPVFLDRGTLNSRLFVASRQVAATRLTKLQANPRDCIEVGLINNMPDLALEQTERQILKLLNAAAGDLVVKLTLFALSDLPRGELGRNHLRRLHYRKVDELSSGEMDALIITGAEPRAAELRNEPYWGTLTQVFDWANDNTISTIFSCLAVHAAVLHFDGIERNMLKRKCFGVFEFEQDSHNEILKGIVRRFRMPHSRWNRIKEEDLRVAGYEVLSRGSEGVDMFVRSGKSFFVFFQGHPEYEAWTLLGEYRRDVGRYLAGEQTAYPDMPAGYFDQHCVSTLNAFRSRAIKCRQQDLMPRFPIDQLAGRLADVWREIAAGVYANWLKYIAIQKGGAGGKP